MSVACVCRRVRRSPWPGGPAARGLRLAADFLGRLGSEPAPARRRATLLPASIPAADLVGRWGLAAYHKDEDRARTEAAARGQCKQPYNIGRGPGGGVDHASCRPVAADRADAQGRRRTARTTSASPMSRPAAQRDREIVSFDGRVLITALDRSRDRRPLRHQRLCALRPRLTRRRRSGPARRKSPHRLPRRAATP